jgi:hypothetical protein
MSPVEQMKVAVQILQEPNPSLALLEASGRLEEVQTKYKVAVKSEIESLLSDKDWAGLLPVLEDEATLTGGWAQDRADLRAFARQASVDRAAVLYAQSLVEKGSWPGAKKVLERIGDESPVVDEARTLRQKVGLKEAYSKAKELFAQGKGFEAAERMSDVASRWPDSIEGREEVEGMVRQIGQVVELFQRAEEKASKGDHRSARGLYRDLLKKVGDSGSYTREAKRGLRACEDAAVRELAGMRDEFRSAVQAGRWDKGVELFRAIVSVDDQGEALSELQTELAAQAPSICKRIERKCWSGKVEDEDRSAVLLLEAVLNPSHSALERLTTLKREYPRHFGERKS